MADAGEAGSGAEQDGRQGPARAAGGDGAAAGGEDRKRKRDRAESAEDALVPHEPLARVMRRALKPSTTLERGAVRAVQTSLSEMVMVVVGEASERCMLDDRRYLTAEDLLWALRELGLEVYTPSLETLLEKYRNQQQEAASETGQASAP